MENTDKGFEFLFTFFEESQQIEYQTPHLLFPQLNDETCVAACVQMILSDFGIFQPQSFLISELETNRGAFLSKVPQVLEEFDVKGFVWKKDLEITDLSNALKTNPSIVSLRRKNANFGHAVIADAIINDTIGLRDPLPIGQGKSYAVKLKTFQEVWLESGIIYVG